jgi:hypothetical protein
MKETLAQDKLFNKFSSSILGDLRSGLPKGVNRIQISLKVIS